VGQQAAQRWLIYTASFGLVIWLIAWGASLGSRNFLHEVELLLFFGVAVTTPLAMRLALQPDRNGTISLVCRLAMRGYPGVILTTGGALMLDVSVVATLLAAIWQLQTALLALYGLQRFLPRPSLNIEEICIDAGLLYVPISGVWLLSYVSGIQIFTFDRAITLLTAVHFTFINVSFG
jgi:hypothetical protein